MFNNSCVYYNYYLTYKLVRYFVGWCLKSAIVRSQTVMYWIDESGHKQRIDLRDRGVMLFSEEQFKVRIDINDA